MRKLNLLLLILFCQMLIVQSILAEGVDSLNVERVGSLYNENMYIEEVIVSGDYAYLMSHGTLRIVDITDPSSPVEVGSIDIFGSIRDFTVSGSYAYVATHLSGLHIVDISDPLLPFLVGTYQTSDRLKTVEVYGDYAFITHDEYLDVIDISDPSNPVEIGNLDVGIWTSKMALYRSNIYLLHFDGLEIIDISDPSTPVYVGGLWNVAPVQSISFYDDFAYYNTVAYTSDIYSVLYSLLVLDIADPSDPVVVESPFPMNWGAFATEVSESGEYLYSVVENGLQIYNISDLSGPEVGFWYSDNYDDADRVCFDVSSTYAYVVNTSGFTIFDCSQAVGVDEEEQKEIPTQFSITNAYPNPFNPTLNITIALPETSDLKVVVYNIMGQSVATLSNGGQYSAGNHSFIFNSDGVTSHSSGVYFVQASIPGKLNQIQKVVLMK
jgi:hypothetical protein